ncbi:MAG: EamA family transporter [Rubripirellula sp.]
MSWIALSLLSAIFLGCYDIAKKSSVRDNSVPVVLLLNVLTAALFWSVPISLAFVAQNEVTDSPSNAWLSNLVTIGAEQHALLFGKSALVGVSWICAFFALKHLPISIATPIRATSPLWTVTLAVTCMGERPTALQWLGIAIVLAAFLAFSRVGAREGIHFHRDRWVYLMAIATLLGAISALYDKYLLQELKLAPATVQAWFSVYLVPIMLPLAVRWYQRDRISSPFQWRVTIPLIAVFLLIADYSYFCAIAQPDAMITVISPIRRSAIVIPFLFGIVSLREENWRLKAPCIAATLLGVFLLSQAS